MRSVCLIIVLLSFFVLCSCTQNNSTVKDSSLKFQQYYIKGEALYLKHCSNCHQKDGAGLGRLYPPLDTSDYMTLNFNDVICLQRHGKEGALVVNGKNFNMKMPAPIGLSDLEIAQISTYIYNSWSHNRGIVDVAEASTILKACQSK